MRSFKFAFDGLKEAFRNGRNFRIQVFTGVVAIFLGFLMEFSRVELAVLTITAASVLILEIINTSLESIVDIVSPEIREKARIAKDMAAASVLVSAIASVIVGSLLFLPRLFPNL